MLNYIITIAISAFFVPHYLSIFWGPLRENPWDIVGGGIVIVLLVTLEHRRHSGVGARQHRARADRLRDAGAARALGFALIFSPHVLSSNIHFGVAPTWSQFFLAIPVAMIAYTGIETVSNLAEEARDPVKNIPRAIRLRRGRGLRHLLHAARGSRSRRCRSRRTPDGQLPDAARAWARRRASRTTRCSGLVENLGVHGAVAQRAEDLRRASWRRRSSSSPPTRA